MIREKLNPNWMNKLLDKGEEVGFSKQVLEKFMVFYVMEGGIKMKKLLQLLKDYNAL